MVVRAERFLGTNTATEQIRQATESMEGAIFQELKERKCRMWLLDGVPRRVSDCPGQILIDLRNLGFNVFSPDKEKGSWEAGINEVRVAFQKDQIEIDPACVWLTQTLDFGLFTENRKDFERTEALGHLDMLAALIYAWRHRVLENPFPRHLGKNRIEHHLTDAKEPSVLEKAFLSAD
jgi:hypothetical protein